MKSLTILVAYLSLPWLSLATQADALIIVADHGGTSALPYYEALNLQPRAEVSAPPIEIPRPPAKPFNEADMLPVRSMQLSPGDVARRLIEAPGMPPFFLVGDDNRSRLAASARTAHTRAQCRGPSGQRQVGRGPGCAACAGAGAVTVTGCG